MLDGLHDGVAVSDTAGVVVYVNEANTRITGLRREQVIDRPVREVVPDSHLLEALASGRELVGVRTQVAGREVLSNIVPLYSEGRLVGAVSLFRDLTEVLALTAQLQEARNTIAILREHLAAPPILEGMVVGRSPLARRALTLALKAAEIASPVLIEGRSGTGKELIARLIHARSERQAKPFLAINCAALPATLLESELFGYEEGAFTGARRGGRAGLLELADGGTLFLDEVGDMEQGMQAKLLRALQNGEFRRLGGGAIRRADVRIISATNQPLADLVAQGRFREDLYYRLRVIRILLPALRERREDLPELIEHALERACTRLRRRTVRIDPAAMRLLLAYDYPGNIRELENLVEQAVALDEDGLITEEELPIELAPHRAQVAAASLPFGDSFPTWEELERSVLVAGLQRFRSKSALAQHLGISRATLYRKLERYDLD